MVKITSSFKNYLRYFGIFQRLLGQGRNASTPGGPTRISSFVIVLMFSSQFSAPLVWQFASSLSLVSHQSSAPPENCEAHPLLLHLQSVS